MIRKILVMPLLCIGMAFFVQCSDTLSDYSADDQVLKAGKGPGGGGGGGGGETETAVNNLSYPVFTADGFNITPLAQPSFSVPYTGAYPGLTADEIAALGAGPWYPQKTDDNVWQADFAQFSGAGTFVKYIDWGDVLESVNPTVGRPTRIEVTLYALTDNVQSEPLETMTGYTMAVLEYPSSPSELQGTNTVTYPSSYATVVSGLPKLVIQYVGATDINSLTWDGDSWQSGGTDLPIIAVAFGPELNVGGKYIYGASSGGWKPAQPGIYRLTFYLPGSEISLGEAAIGSFSAGFTGSSEGVASTPVVDAVNNLTYDDVTVVTKGGGGGGSGRR